MPPPSTVPELLDRVRRSGIVAADRLDAFVVEYQPESSASVGTVLEHLIEAGLITRFHSDKLASGKYKGFQLGNYLILDQIGTGGTGQVYLAEHTNMRRLVAIKVLPVFSSEDAVARERFFREARAAGTLDHPNIVRVFDLCQDGKLLYLVMEYVEGVSLQSVVDRHGPLQVDAAADYAGQVACGLHHAHELRFVHRDIKPANLLLDRLGVVKILDLGLVRSEADSESGLTKKLENQILGTADYVAPEQAVNSSDVDIRADIYSLGATLYYLLTGRPLFPGGRTAQKLVWQQIKDPVPVDRLRVEVSPALAQVVHRMLQKRAVDRYQSPAEVVEALAPFVPDGVAPPDSAWMPEVSARVAIARAAIPSPSAPRGTGSTSQIHSAALRGGASETNSSARRSAAKGMHRGGRDRDETPPTRAVALDDTQRPDDHTADLVPGAYNSSRWHNVVLTFLVASLVVAIVAISVILLLRK